MRELGFELAFFNILLYCLQRKKDTGGSGFIQYLAYILMEERDNNHISK